MGRGDAVILVPGIMGSQLRTAGGVLLWGLDAGVLGRAWMSGQMTELAVTPEDLQDRARVRATGLLRVPGWAPFLGGVEPYGRLLRRLREECGDDRAVAEFAYDWRLPVAWHVPGFLDACIGHLQRWQSVVAADSTRGDPAAVRLVIVAHSMGGLLTRLALMDTGLAEVTRVVVTLGTPYYGSLNALQMLATGQGGPPVPELAAQALARTCPGVYDLLPMYKCVTDDRGGYRSLTPADVASVGGDGELTRQAQQRWSALGLRSDQVAQAAGVGSVSVVPVVGCDQPTWASVGLAGGGFELSRFLGGVVEGGDSKVWRRAAAPADAVAQLVPQTHGALAKDSDAIRVVVDKVLDRDGGPPMGTRPLGLDAPGIVNAGEPVMVAVTENPDGPGARPGDPVGLQMTSQHLDTGRTLAWPPGRPRDGQVLFSRPGLAPGLHRLKVSGGGFSPVAQIVLAQATS